MLVDGLVSTIIPVHNRSALLREAVDSVLAQTYRPIEIIIVDDGSTDKATPQVALEFASAFPDVVQVVFTPHHGPGAAREAGRRKARGSFIQYLDSDDVLLPHKFDAQVSGLKQSPQCDVSYGQTYYQRVGEDSSNQPWKRTGERIERMFPSFVQSRWWGTSTPLYRRYVTDRAGPWLPLTSEEDWEYDCRIASFGAKLHYCEAVLSIERSHDGQRLSNGSATDPLKLADRAKVHELILGHARNAGISREIDEMQHFSRALFLLSRQCGAAGLRKESERLFHLARETSLPDFPTYLEFRVYEMVAHALGWTTIGWLAVRLDEFRQ